MRINLSPLKCCYKRKGQLTEGKEKGRCTYETTKRRRSRRPRQSWARSGARTYRKAHDLASCPKPGILHPADICSCQSAALASMSPCFTSALQPSQLAAFSRKASCSIRISAKHKHSREIKAAGKCYQMRVLSTINAN